MTHPHKELTLRSLTDSEGASVLIPEVSTWPIGPLPLIFSLWATVALGYILAFPRPPRLKDATFHTFAVVGVASMLANFVPALMGFEYAADENKMLLLHIVYAISTVCGALAIGCIDFAFVKRGMLPPIRTQVIRKAKTRTKAGNLKAAIGIFSFVVAVFLVLWLAHMSGATAHTDHLDLRGRALSLLLGNITMSSTYAWCFSCLCGFFLIADIYLLIEVATHDQGHSSNSKGHRQ